MGRRTELVDRRGKLSQLTPDELEVFCPITIKPRKDRCAQSKVSNDGMKECGRSSVGNAM